MTDAALGTPAVSASDTIKTIGILHFTIGVRDHIAAAKFYSEVLGCTHMRSSERYSFMECGGTYFVLAALALAAVSASLWVRPAALALGAAVVAALLVHLARPRR